MKLKKIFHIFQRFICQFGPNLNYHVLFIVVTHFAVDCINSYLCDIYLLTEDSYIFMLSVII